MGEVEGLKKVPMSREHFPRTWNTLDSGLAEGVFPGVVAGLWRSRDPGSIFIASCGNRRNLPSSLPMQPDTVFDLASVSKVMGAATLCAWLVERRWLDWETPVKAIFPEFCSSEIQLKHLLSHTAGFVAWEPYWERLRVRFGKKPIERFSVADRQSAMREFIFAARPEAAPGERAVYSDISFLLLGFVLEEVTGLALDQAVMRLLWQPMGLQTAYYRRVTQSVLEARIDEVAATELCPWRGGVVQGQVHDDNTWAMGGYAGHAGAFGNVSDVLQFSKVLVEGFLSPGVQDAAWTRVSSPVGCGRTLGWDTPSGLESAAGKYFSARSIGHLGFTGTSLWIDRDAGLAVTLLTNRVHPSRDNILIRTFRPRFHEAIRLDIRALGL